LTLPLFSRLLPGPLDEKAQRTFTNDCLRQLFVGFLDTGSKTFFLLIIVRQFSASDLFKSLVSVPSSLGMTLSILLLPLLARFAHRKNIWLATARVITGICFLIAAWKPSLQTYVFWVVLGSLPSVIVYPLLTTLYNENYPRRIRGQLYAWASMVNMGSGAISSWLIGLWLGKDAENYPSLLAAYGMTAILSAWFMFKIPSKATAKTNGRSFLHAFKWIRHDRTFAYMLAVWFIFGFGIFMMSPLKVLYLTESRYGILYSTATVAFIIGFLPEVFRMLTTPIWARLFDRYHFVGIRIGLNLFLLASMLAFFMGKSKLWLCIAAALEGISSGGAGIAWALWVTHIAPAEHITEYMSVNLFFTGFRGIVGTFAGIHLASAYGLINVVWFTIALVVLSILMMIPIRNDRRWMRIEAAR
jgi:MFS family permease